MSEQNFPAAESMFDSLFMVDAAIADEIDDVRDLESLIDQLIAVRKASNLRQKDVAEAMQVSQSRVSQFEAGGADPRVSTLQQYARAVHLRLHLVLDDPAQRLRVRSNWRKTARWESHEQTLDWMVARA